MGRVFLSRKEEKKKKIAEKGKYLCDFLKHIKRGKREKKKGRP